MRYRYLLSVYLCYVPVASGLGLWTWQAGRLPSGLWPMFIILGVVCWTLIEYVLHRFVLHLQAPTAGLQRAIERLHLGHHWEPADVAKITVPVYGSLPIAVALLGLWRLLSGSWQATALLMIGTIIGYLTYETMHFRIHCCVACGRWLCWQRAQHFVHHFKNHERCFGVTTPLWDWVFGTR
jgi:hypothetical protein